MGHPANQHRRQAHRRSSPSVTANLNPSSPHPRTPSIAPQRTPAPSIACSQPLTTLQHALPAHCRGPPAHPRRCARPRPPTPVHPAGPDSPHRDGERRCRRPLYGAPYQIVTRVIGGMLIRAERWLHQPTTRAPEQA